MTASSAEVSSSKQILVTGGNGFIGRHLLVVLRDSGYRVRAAVRQHPQSAIPGIDYFECGAIHANTDWHDGLSGVDCVIHLAAHVHVMRAQPGDRDVFHRVNVQGSMRLAHMALQHSVQRFIYLSSIKVNGEDSGQRAFSAHDARHPQDDYARSKAVAEKSLLEEFRNSRLQIVVIRPPLVYGKAVRGNMRLLMRAIDLHLPLPFASVHNQRSLVSVLNLCDLIQVCCDHPAAAGEIFLVSDDQDLSTPSLIALLAAAMQRRAILLPCPMVLLQQLSRLPFLRMRMQRLLGNLQIDITKTKRLLGWSPPYKPDAAIRTMMDA